MPKPRAWLVSTLLLAVVCSAAAAAGHKSASATPLNRSASTTALDPRDPDNPFLREVGERLQAVGKQDAAYAGVTMDYATQTLTVYRLDGGDGIASTTQSAYAAEIPASVTLFFRPAMLSGDQISVLNQLVVANHDKMAALGINAVSWGETGSFSTPFNISYAGSTNVPDAVRNIFSLYGSDKVTFSPDAKQPLPLDRTADTSPFFGGNGSRAQENAAGAVPQCSSGFVFYSIKSKHLYMSEAWHCQSEQSLTKWFATWGGSGGYYMGEAVTLDHDQDTAFVDLTAAGTSGLATIYSGLYSANNDTRDITGATSGEPMGGDSVCVSGATSGSHCNLNFVTNGQVSEYLTNEYNGNTAYVTAYLAQTANGAIAAATGDSGGPAYHKSGTGAIAAGTISFSYNSDDIPCPSYTFNRPNTSVYNIVCTDTVAIVSIHDIFAVEQNLIVANFPS